MIRAGSSHGSTVPGAGDGWSQTEHARGEPTRPSVKFNIDYTVKGRGGLYKL